MARLEGLRLDRAFRFYSLPRKIREVVFLGGNHVYGFCPVYDEAEMLQLLYFTPMAVENRSHG